MGKHVALYFQNRNQTINTCDESCSLNIYRARTTLMIVHNLWKHSLRVRGFKATHEEHNYLLLLA